MSSDTPAQLDTGTCEVLSFRVYVYSRGLWSFQILTASAHRSRSPSPTGHDVLTLRALVSTKDAGVIIGKGGKNVADLREQTGVKAGVSKVIAGVHERVLTVSGSVEGVAKVRTTRYMRLLARVADSYARGRPILSSFSSSLRRARSPRRPFRVTPRPHIRARFGSSSPTTSWAVSSGAAARRSKLFKIPRARA